MKRGTVRGEILIMIAYPKISNPELRRILIESTNECPSAKAIGKLVEIASGISASYLRVKIFNGKLNLDFFGIPLNDLAIDCIAELFRRDDKGVLTEFQGKFTDIINTEPLDKIKLFSRLRSIVFNSVDRSLFKLYGTFDSSLARFIRNLKLAVKGDSDIHLYKRNGEALLMTKSSEGTNNKNFPPFDLLRIEIMRKLKPGFTTNDFLKCLHDALIIQEEYSNTFPLTGGALLLRSIYAEKAESLENEFEYPFWGYDLEKLIGDVVGKMEKQIITKYYEKGKILREDIKIYCALVGEILKRKFISGNLDEHSYYDLSKSRISDLTPESYVKKYKTKIEYLAKIAKAELKESIKKEL
jgi:hypothetical protein